MSEVSMRELLEDSLESELLEDSDEDGFSPDMFDDRDSVIEEDDFIFEYEEMDKNEDEDNEDEDEIDVDEENDKSSEETESDNSEELSEGESSEEEKEKINKIEHDWTYPLSDVMEDIFEFDEFNKQIYSYKRVKSPDGGDTDLINVFCKNIETNRWYAKSLSNIYVVTILHKFVENLCNIEGLVLNNPTINIYPFMIEYNSDTPFMIDIFNSEEDQLIYRIMTGADEDIDNMKTNMGISIINSYNGFCRMGVNYVLNIRSGSNSDIYRDIFTLANREFHIRHSRGEISRLYEDVGRVRDSINTNIQYLKEKTENINKLVNMISKELLAAQRDTFLGIVEGLHSNMRNFYYVLVSASYVLTKEKNAENIRRNEVIRRRIKTLL